VRRGSGRERRERRQKGPSKCRVCRASLVTPREHALGRCDGCSVDIDVDLLDALRAWRLETSREMGVPAYVVFTDVTLTAIAEQRPADVDALSAISGIGPRKLGQFGAAVLEIVRAYS
jgi:DNA helicase-2/ATP-dependent DNA helicase PcrA